MAVSKLEFGFERLSDSYRLAKAQRHCIDTCPSVYAGHKGRAPPAISDCFNTEEPSTPYTARKQYERFLSHRFATLCGGNAVRSTFRITGSVRLGRYDVPDPSAEWRRKHQLHSMSHLKLPVTLALPCCSMLLVNDLLTDPCACCRGPPMAQVKTIKVPAVMAQIWPTQMTCPGAVA